MIEAETLARTSSAGVTTQVDNEAGFSGGAGVKLNGVAAGNYIEFTMPAVPSGTYNITLTYKTWGTRGQVKLTADGSALGSVDQYAATPAYGHDVALGQHIFNGNALLRFTVTGKNAASAGFTASVDKITLSTPGSTAVYLDPAQPIETRITDLMSRLTIEQKISQLLDFAPPIPALNIPPMDGWNQCLHGVVWDRPTTLFPICTGLGASWDPALVNEVASAIGDEARAVNNVWRSGGGGRHNGLLYRSPVVDMGRDPRWGRNNEIYGEDPLLTSRMGVAYVEGLQGTDPKYLKIAATLKHIGAYNREIGRTNTSATVSERWLREYYLPPFKVAIQEARAQSIMSSYNALNGTPNTINRALLTDLLKKEWGFDGIQVPDLDAVQKLVKDFHRFSTDEEAAVAAFHAGIDMGDNDSGEAFSASLAKAWTEGKITAPEVDAAYRRVLRVRFKLGEFDSDDLQPYRKIPASKIASNGPLALTSARAGIVLLKNSGNTLPLDRSKIHSIAVIGPHGDLITPGTYTGKFSNTVTALQGIKNRAAPGTQVVFSLGSNFTTVLTDGLTAAANAARAADVAVIFVGTNRPMEQEGHDRSDIALPACQRDLVKQVLAANPKTIVVYMSAGPVSDVSGEGAVPASLCAWWGGQEGGNAIADVLFGDYNPGGKLPYTIYRATSDLPSATDYDISHGYTYMYFKGQPLYPFGHGLSYTSFLYSNLQVTAPAGAAGGVVTVSVNVKNAGARKGDEVVQIYAHYPASSLPRPSKQLVAFQRITLDPGAAQTVTLQVPQDRLHYWDEVSHSFVVASGSYTLDIGSSSQDTRLSGTFSLP